MSSSEQKLDNIHVRLNIRGLTEKRYERVRSQYTALRDIEKSFAKQTGAFSPYIVRDIWSGLNNPTTEVDAKTEKDPIRQVVEWGLSQMRSVPGYAVLESDSRSNVINATLTTKAVVKVLAGLDWPDPPKRGKGKGPGGEPCEGEGEGDPETWEGKGEEVEISVRPSDPNNPGSDQPHDVTVSQSGEDEHGPFNESVSTTYPNKAAAEEAIRKIAEKLQAKGMQKQPAQGMQDQLDAFRKQVEKMLAGLDGVDKQDAREAGEEAVAAATKDSTDIIEAITTTFGREKAEHVFKDPTDADMEIVRRILAQKRLHEFIKIVGRFMKSMRRSRVRERVPGKTIPLGVTRAKDLRTLLPMEAALMAVPGIAAHQITRVLTRQAAGYRTWDYSSKGNGPVHVSLDISGSMSSFRSPGGVYYGNAFACAAVLYSLEQRRKVSCTVFDTSIEEIPLAGEDPASRAAFIEAMLRVEPRGGTSFVPLMHHVESLGYCDDVLLISDGQGDVDDDHARKVFRSRNLNYLVVGASDCCVMPVLKELAGDRMLLSNDLLNGDASALAARAVARK